MLEKGPFEPRRGVPRGFCDGTTRRALTSLEEKIKVCERPDRLGSATNPAMSELGLAGLESSTTERLCKTSGRQGMHLPGQQPQQQQSTLCYHCGDEGAGVTDTHTHTHTQSATGVIVANHGSESAQ